jgi:8-oxo-dGTP diphosphatase
MLKQQFSKLKANKYVKNYCLKISTSPYSHCGYCGVKSTMPLNTYKCVSCNNTTFRNPIPVAVGLLPFVTIDNNFGLLLVKRAIKPYVGELCLPGGFVNWGESWQEAVSREIFEETSVITQPNEFLLKDVHSTPDNARILIFGYSRQVRSVKEIENFKPTNESSATLVGLHDTKLCFSLHQLVYNDWFDKALKE